MHRMLFACFLINQFIVFLLLQAASAAFAASFECNKASKPIEKLVCATPELSKADEELGLAYDFLSASCTDLAQEEKLLSSQRRWLGQLRSLAEKDGAQPSEILDQYQDRNDYLAGLIRRCSPDYPRPRSLVLNPLKHGTDGSSPNVLNIPYVETDPPKVGHLLNQQIFQELFYETAPPRRHSNGLTDLLKEYREGRRSPDRVDYSEEYRDDRLLVLRIALAGCEASCGSADYQLFFDVRTGRKVMTEEMFSPRGAAAIGARLRAPVVGTLKARLKREGVSDDERSAYASCLDLKTYGNPPLALSRNRDGRWRFAGDGCDTRGWPRPLRNSDMVLTSEELRPHLNAYGRSLLLGDGDVLSPTEGIEQCQSISLPKRTTSPVTNKIAEIVGSNNDRFLVLKSGQVWRWGPGRWRWSNAPHSETEMLLVGQGFKQLRLTDGGTANGILQDGSLVQTANVNDKFFTAGRSGAIDSDFAQVLAGSVVFGLKNDGSAWYDGKRLGENVKQIGRGYGTDLLLKKDGSLWAWGVPALARKENKDWWRIGGGFDRLAAEFGDLAYKSDGSLWAWHKALAGTRNTERLDLAPERIGKDYRNVDSVSGFDGEASYLVGVKTDGGLWATYKWGYRDVRLERLDCGYAEAVVTGVARDRRDYRDGLVVLALREDGHLVAWGNWRHKEDWKFASHPLLENPVDLGGGFVKLYRIGMGYGSTAVVLKADGTLWQWKRPDKPQIPRPGNVLLPLEFPKGMNPFEQTAQAKQQARRETGLK